MDSIVIRGLVALACLACAPAAGAATIKADPPLFPTFDPHVRDYVSRCHPGLPLKLTVRATAAEVSAKGDTSRVRGSFHTTLNMRSGAGVKVTTKSNGAYHVRCLADDFPAWTTERHGTPRAQWYIVTPTLGPHGSRYVALFDRHGVPVWWMRGKKKPMDAKLLPDGNLAWSFFGNSTFSAVSVPYEERRLDGKLVRRIAAVNAPTDAHDLQVLPNGRYLVVSYLRRDGVDLSAYGGPADAAVVDAEVQELSAKGKLVWKWNSKDHVALSESEPFMKPIISSPVKGSDGKDVYDIVHINSVERDGKDSLLISMRHTDSVFKVNRKTGAIEWKLGGTRTAESLSVTGEPEGSFTFSGQHDARLLPDGTITLHDNRTGTTLGPHAVRFQVDAAARTATQVEEITDPATIPSLCCGGARRIASGNWVMSWGYNGLVTELTATGQRVFGLDFGPDSQVYSYRAVPLMPGELSARALRAGMDAMHP